MLTKTYDQPTANLPLVAEILSNQIVIFFQFSADLFWLMQSSWLFT